MDKTSLLLIIAIGMPTPVNAHTVFPLDLVRFQAKPHLVIALQDNHPTTGTDSDTISFPNSGIDSTPTMDTGTETNSRKPPPPLPNNPSLPNAPIPPATSPDPVQ